MANVVKTYYRDDREVEGEYTLRRFKYHVDSDGVAVATWAKPDKLNPITRPAVRELYLIFEHAERDPAVRVLVLTHEGRAFSSGMSFIDDKEPTVDVDVMDGYLKANKAWGDDDAALKGLVMRSLRFPKFFISAVSGLAVGGAVNIALLLPDHVILGEGCKFRYPFTELGFSPEISSALVLPQRIGMVRAKELLMLGTWFDGQEAHRLGLCNAVVPDAEVLPHAMQVAKNVAGMSQATLRRSKSIIHRALLQVMDDHMDAENHVFTEAKQCPETMALLQAAMARVTNKNKKAEPSSKL